MCLVFPIAGPVIPTVFFYSPGQGGRGQGEVAKGGGRGRADLWFAIRTVFFLILMAGCFSCFSGWRGAKGERLGAGDWDGVFSYSPGSGAVFFLFSQLGRVEEQAGGYEERDGVPGYLF